MRGGGLGEYVADVRGRLGEVQAMLSFRRARSPIPGAQTGSSNAMPSSSTRTRFAPVHGGRGSLRSCTAAKQFPHRRRRHRPLRRPDRPTDRGGL